MTQEKDEDKGSDMTSHDWGTGKGEEMSSNQGKEAGREDEGTDDSGRPTGTRTARDSTSVNAEAKRRMLKAIPSRPPDSDKARRFFLRAWR